LDPQSLLLFMAALLSDSDLETGALPAPCTGLCKILVNLVPRNSKAPHMPTWPADVASPPLHAGGKGPGHARDQVRAWISH